MRHGYISLPSDFYGAVARWVVECRPTWAVEDVSFALYLVDRDCDGDDMAPSGLMGLKCAASFAMKDMDDGRHPNRAPQEAPWDVACQEAWLDGRRAQRQLSDAVLAVTGLRPGGPQ